MRGGGHGVRHGSAGGWRGAGARSWERPRGPWGWGMGRWQWGGSPVIWAALDEDRDDRLTVDELLEALGPRGLDLLAGEAGDPVPRHTWDGRTDVFDALDENGDGYVEQGDVDRGIGHAAKRLLLHGEPPGPELPAGARYEQRGGALWVTFPGREAKARYMVEAAARDASDPAVVSWARQFMKLAPERRGAAILRFCQLAVRYQRDPAWYDRSGNRHGIEVLDSSAVVLFRGYGDCDAKTRLLLALCQVCGVPARLAPVFKGVDGFPHVRAEILDERMGRWLVADPSIANSSLGHLPPHNRTHMLQRRPTSHGWEVSDDDGTTWHPMEGGQDAGDGDAMPGDDDVPGGAMLDGRTPSGPIAGEDDLPGGALPGEQMPGEQMPGGPMPGGAPPSDPMPGSPVPSVPMPSGATAGDAPQTVWQRRHATPGRPKPVVRISRRLRFRPGSTITTTVRGGNLTQRWRVGRDGVTLTALGPATRATAESLMAARADRRAAKRIRGPQKGRGGARMPPPRRSMRPRSPGRSAPAPTASMLPSQVGQIVSAVPQVISAVGKGVSSVTSAVQSIAGAFSGFGGGVGEAGYTESETAIPGINAIISALGSTAFRLEDFIARTRGRIAPTPEQADAWLRAFRIDPGLLFVARHTSVEAAARLARYLKLASGEKPMRPGWQLDRNPYLTQVDPADPLTDPLYLQSIRDAIVGTSDPRVLVEHLARQPVIVTRETARRMLALLRHELVTNGLPHWAEVQGSLGDIAREIGRVRKIAGEEGTDPHLARLFGDVTVPAGASAANAGSW